MSYSEEHGITVESIQDDLDCNELTGDKVLSICEAGYEHGLEGLYIDDDPSEDDEWDSTVGRKVRAIEEELELDNSEINAYYMEALNAGHIDSTNNYDGVREDSEDMDGFQIYE